MQDSTLLQLFPTGTIQTKVCSHTNGTNIVVLKSV